MTGKERGRSPGGKKRKAEHELSITSRVERACAPKRAIRKQRWRKKKKLYDSIDYKNASSAQQKLIEAAALNRIEELYKSRRKHPDQLKPDESSHPTGPIDDNDPDTSHPIENNDSKTPHPTGPIEDNHEPNWNAFSDIEYNLQETLDSIDNYRNRDV
ncbi:hypothetical protein FVEN_g5501 [Fusarium venenatum]|nr:hypothetical protein FVEN_g5501 [Fusarium venenatum]